MFKNCAPFTNCIGRINNTQVDDTSYTDVVMPMYNLIEHGNNYLKTSGILWEFYRDVTAVNADGVIVDFTKVNIITELFNLKVKLTDQQIIVPLKYLSNFRGILEMSLINCEITSDLNWSENRAIAASNGAYQGTTF